jgi:hypothetical protein
LASRTRNCFDGVDGDMMMETSAESVFDREFPALRGRILEVAAALDRIARAGGAPSADPRADQLRRSLELLADRAAQADRAEAVQMVFSLPYDPDWRAKFDRT